MDYGNGAVYEGELMDFERCGKGIMVFVGENYFSGKFVGNNIDQEGGLLNFNDNQYEVQYIHISQFDIGIFVEKLHRQLFVLDCQAYWVYDSELIDQLKESGIDIRESLRDFNLSNWNFGFK